jgi:nitroreductase
MDTWDALMNRRTAHDYLPEPVPAAVVDRALQAANRAPCHRFTWPWRFVVVGPQTRQALVPIAVAAKERKRALSEKLRGRIGRTVLNPGALIVACQIRSDDAFRSREDYAAVACAIQNILLSARADGFESKWSSGGVTTDPQTYRALGIDPQTEEIVGFVWIGRAECLPEVSRPELADVVRRLP